ncbi:MAG: T9SS type A sorting domain-containing protein [Bacteroidota bacterium]
MKRILFIVVIALLACGAHEAKAQAKKYVIFEHFTQASCGPCAQQNPAMAATLAANEGRYHQFSYHTSWPGVDPMNAYNPTQVADRVTYYGVTGVPDVVGCGNKYRGSPTGCTQTLIDNLASDASPIRLIVRETSNGTVRTVKVKVFTVDTMPAGPFKIRVGVLERNVHYNTPPGSNGEKDFPDVFRKMLPSTAGDAFVPAAIGDSVTMTYTYNLDLAVWDTTKIYTCAFIQKDATKEIINSGSTIDPHWEFVGLGQNFKMGYPGEVKSFHYKVYNLGSAGENFKFKLKSTHKGSWSANFTVNGNNYNDSVNILVPGRATWDLYVNVTIGADACLGEYAMTVKSLDNLTFAPVTLKAHTIYGVYEIVINNDGGWGDGSGMTPVTFQHYYTDGLDYAGANAYGVLDLTSFKKGYGYGCMQYVTNYYFNVGWSFPAFTDESVAIFTSELNAGKNMLVSGQDVGWDTWTATASGGHGTVNTKAFYTNFLNATFLNDGTTADNTFVAESTDPLYGSVPQSPVVNMYGGSNFFPDEISATGIGTNIFYYNTTKTKKGGVRATNGTWKTVYISPSMEMIQSNTSRNEIIKISHVWFGGSPWTGIKPVEGERKSSLGQNYPNPASGNTTILLNGIDRNMTLQLVDLTGRTLFTEMITSGQSSLTINTSAFANGIYFYQLIGNGKVIDTKKMQVVH